MADYYNSGEIDLGLLEGELLTGMTSFNGNLYVFTNRRCFIVKKKSKWRLWIERLKNRLR